MEIYKINGNEQVTRIFMLGGIGFFKENWMKRNNSQLLRSKTSGKDNVKQQVLVTNEKNT